MAKINLKINSTQLNNIKRKLDTIETKLTAKDAPVFEYMFTICNGYAEAVISGMGQTSTGTLTLKQFLGESQSVNWKPLAKRTLQRKRAAGWKLEIWMATGNTKRAVKVVSDTGPRSIDIYAGIPVGSAEYDKAFATEFGGVSEPGEKRYEGRALFTLLNVILKSKRKVIVKDIMQAVRETIASVGWGM